MVSYLTLKICSGHLINILIYMVIIFFQFCMNCKEIFSSLHTSEMFVVYDILQQNLPVIDLTLFPF